MLINTVFFYGLAAVAFGAVFFLTKDATKAATAAALVSAMAFGFVLLKTPDKRSIFAARNGAINPRGAQSLALERRLHFLKINLISSAVLIASIIGLIVFHLCYHKTGINQIFSIIFALFFLFLVVDITKSTIKDLVSLTTKPRRKLVLRVIFHICVVFVFFGLIIAC